MDFKTTRILGIEVSTLTFNESVEKAASFLESDGYHMIFTPNPEFIMHAQNDRDFYRILNRGDLVVADGIGILIASKLNKVKIKQRTPGINLIQALFEKMKKKGQSVYLFGASPGVAESAAKAIEKKYPGIKVVGFADGFFDKKKERIILKELQKLKPDLLLVGIGFPAQEKWIYENRKRLPVKIAIGCGGSIDILAGKVRRAPYAFQRLGLEWLYRLITQPSRFFRMLKLPLFLLRVISEKFK